MSKLKMSKLSKFAAMLLLPIAANAAMPYGTYLVKTSFRGDYNTVFRDEGEAMVRAQRADGTVIAESTARAANAEGYNFILQIPVAKESTEKACKVGETLDCVFVTSEGTINVPNSLEVGTPITAGILTVCYNDVKSYTNPSDGTVVEIPVEYIGEAEAYLEELGAGTYDPWADYDNDGASNYAEYLAGTNPFDENDILRVTGFSPNGGKLALKFEHVGGHVYAVSSANTLAKPEWAAKRVRKATDGDELDQVLVGGEDGEPGETTIYITPAAGATSEFFKLEAK